MRELHVIGFTSGHDGLILAARPDAKAGSHTLVVDDDLMEQLAQVRAARRTPPPESPALPQRPAQSRSESALSPREIQARLRAGLSVAEVAAEAGVSVDWVDRFAAPVLAEQSAAVNRAMRATLHVPRRGESERPLGPSILHNLAARGLRLTDGQIDGGWSAFHVVDGEWVVSFRFRSRGRDLVAEWIHDGSTGRLLSRNRLGTLLGFVDTSIDAARVAARRTGTAGPRAVRAATARSAAEKAGATRASVPKPALPKALPSGSNGHALAKSKVSKALPASKAVVTGRAAANGRAGANGRGNGRVRGGPGG